ncbi:MULTISPECIES: hypothetical protein [unclassified Spirosoma]|uniref:hypothetical protein n=1 Tax=unclassified Spirosoma TaxID=2621999 RepID=UPI0009658980|nr:MULTISPECIES: hypothetical protein [unclassified Spirosoma]MBN8824174.1 hypothetical protein [Spirosoma sp.]OJW78911.1 MAG: hypothetical protein BGO59_10605 [Spirosoma sp. 48-14]
MKTLLFIVVGLIGLSSFFRWDLVIGLTSSVTIDSLGACQGVSYQPDKVYLYGDREVGMIRSYRVGKESLTYTGQEVKLTVDGQDVINHPTGIAYNQTGPTFIGNSIRLNPEGTKWRAVIYMVNWAGLLRTGTLDDNLLNTIEDDACIQGTRPEYVRYQNKWYVATADYGDKANEVRLYDPLLLAKAKKTSEPGVVVKKFTCSPWVQNLHWVPSKGVLVLIQNQIEGRRWRFTFLDLKRSIESGREQVIKTVDIDKADELEGFTLLGDRLTGLAVTSSRTNNVHFMNLAW